MLIVCVWVLECLRLNLTEILYCLATSFWWTADASDALSGRVGWRVARSDRPRARSERTSAARSCGTSNVTPPPKCKTCYIKIPL